MEIKQLEYFLTVSETKSFTRAAERLFVSQPSVTNVIRGLESELGIRLFERGQKNALLTAEGRIFQNHVEPLMNSISHTLDEIHAIKNLRGGVLRIGLSPFACVSACTDMIKIFMESHPQIRIEIVEAGAEALEKQLMDGNLDAAMTEMGGTHLHLRFVPLTNEELVLICGKNHRLRRYNTLNAKDITGERLLLLEEATAKTIAENMDSASAMSNAIIAKEVQTIKSLTAAGCGVGFLPESLCDTDSALTAIALEPSIRISVGLAYQAARHPSHAMEAFLALAEQGGTDHA